MRAEPGLEQLESRWEKLRFGYWRRMQVADPNRILAIVARKRREEVREGGQGRTLELDAGNQGTADEQGADHALGGPCPHQQYAGGSLEEAGLSVCRATV